MSQALTLARPYARAAFSIARDAGRFAGWSAALGFAARLAADPQGAGLLGNPELADADVRADACHVAEARVTSAAAPPAGELAGIRAALKQRLGREADGESRFEPSLTGGAGLDAGAVVTDGSLKGKLERLQAALAQ